MSFKAKHPPIIQTVEIDRKMFQAYCRSARDPSILTIASRLADPIIIIVLTSMASNLLLFTPCRVSGAMAVQPAASQQMSELDPGVKGELMNSCHLYRTPT